MLCRLISSKKSSNARPALAPNSSTSVSLARLPAAAQAPNRSFTLSTLTSCPVFCLSSMSARWTFFHRSASRAGLSPPPRPSSSAAMASRVSRRLNTLWYAGSTFHRSITSPRSGIPNRRSWLCRVLVLHPVIFSISTFGMFDSSAVRVSSSLFFCTRRSAADSSRLGLAPLPCFLSADRASCMSRRSESSGLGGGWALAAGLGFLAFLAGMGQASIELTESPQWLQQPHGCWW